MSEQEAKWALIGYLFGIWYMIVMMASCADPCDPACCAEEKPHRDCLEEP